MRQFVERMIAEKSDLSAKIKRARAVVENPPFGSCKESIMMLAEQLKAMESYLYWLSERINFEEGKNGI